jgi:chromosome segregation ATPase
MPLTNTEIEKKLRQHDNEIVTIYDMLAEIKQVQTAHSADLTTLKTDVSTLKTDVSILKVDVSILKTDVATLKDGVAEILRRLPEAS